MQEELSEVGVDTFVFITKINICLMWVSGRFNNLAQFDCECHLLVTEPFIINGNGSLHSLEIL